MQEPPDYQQPNQQPPPYQPPQDPQSALEKWEAMSSQQKLVIALILVAVALMIAILITLIVRSGDDNGDGAAIDPTPTHTPVIVEVTSTPEPTSEAEPTNTPEPEPTETPEPEPTETPEPEPTETPEPEPTATEEPTATPEPEPTATATVEPTATQAPEPTATAVPTPFTGQVSVEDPSGDVRSTEGAAGIAGSEIIDLVEIELELDEEHFKIDFFSAADIPASLPAGVTAHWMLIIWIDDVETYRIAVTLEGDEFTVTLTLVIDDDQDDEERELEIVVERDDEKLSIEIPRSELPLLTGPFTWAAMGIYDSTELGLYGDNLPDAGDEFNEEPDVDEREPFPDDDDDD